MSAPSPPHTGDNPTDMSSPHIDIHQDLFPDYYDGTASAPAAPKDEFPWNDIDNGSNKDEFHVTDIQNGSNQDGFPVTDIQNGSSDCPPVSKENDFPAPAPVPLDSIPEPAPVPPGSSGEGLPYAPADWPNAGDIWSWKVGKRVSTSGFFHDRSLSVPESVRKSNFPKIFSSKPMLECCIRSNFPDADIDAFFASFVWKIPAIMEPSTKALTPSAPAEAALAGEMEDHKKEITPRRTNRKRAPPPSPFIAPTSTPNDSQKKQKTPKGLANSKGSTKPEGSSKPQGSAKPKGSTKPEGSSKPQGSAKSKGSTKPKGSSKPQGATKPTRQTRQSLKESSPPVVEIQAANDGIDYLSFLDDEAGRAEFDNYLNSLDKIFFPTQPSFEEPLSQQAAKHNIVAEEGEMIEARRKLSSLLDMDFSSLICFKSLTPSAPAEAAPTGEMEDIKKEITPRRTNRKRAPPPSPFIAPTPTPNDSQKKQKTPKGSANSKGSSKPQGSAKSKGSTKPKGSSKPEGATKPKRQTRQSLKESSLPEVEIQAANDGIDDLSFLDDEAGRAEFDNYLNSLDKIFFPTQPSSEEPLFQQAVTHNIVAEEGEMTEARRKLSSLLDMDFPSLICFKDLNKFASLASKIQKDPTLTAEQLVKLELIQVIPTFCEVFLENRGIREEADKLFKALEDNKAKDTSLKQEYSKLKQEITNVQSKMEVQNIENQIAKLKSHCAELRKLIEKKRDKDELI